MDKIAYYRKYRPNSFERIQGQDFIVKTLKNAISQNKIYHAYILSGPRGIGKTSIAKIFSKAINCLDSRDGDCCNKCKNCELINNNKTLDIVEMDAASNNGVNEIRTIIDSCDYKPLDLKYKVYIIDEVHMLTNAAWNALLKTIEEPPKHLIFIFATTEFFKIPPTIISRCQRYNLSRLTYLELKHELSGIIKKENIKIEEKALDKIISIAEGSARDALTILDQLDSYTNSNIKEEDVKEIFGLVSIEDKLDLIVAIVLSDYEKVMSKIDDYDKKGIDFYRLALEISEILFEKLVYERTKKVNFLNILPAINVNFIFIQPKILISLIEIWQKNVNILKLSTSSRFNFESACLSCFKIFQFDNFSEEHFEKPIEKTDVVKDIKINSQSSEKNLQELKMNYVDKDMVLKNVKIKKAVLDDSKDTIISPQEKFENATPIENEPKAENKVVETKSKKEDTKKSTSKTNSNQSIVDAIISRSFETKSIKLSEIKNRFLNKKPEIQKELEDISPESKSDVKLDENKSQIVDFGENNLFSLNEKIAKGQPFAKIVAKEIVNNNAPKKVASISNTKQKSENKKEINKQNSASVTSFIPNDVENVFFQIACNINSKEKERVNKIFEELKNNIPLSPEEGLLTDAKKILLVSNHGIVVIFDDEIDARNINSSNNDSKFITYIKNKFGKVFFVLGLSVSEAKRISALYKDIYKHNKKFDDVDISELQKKVKAKMTAKDIAEKLVSDLIVDEENEEN